MQVRVLGCSGAIAKGCRTTSFLVDGDLLVDAGTGVGELTLDEMSAIDDVVLTHSHLDHIASLPLLLDAVAARRTTPLRVHA
ncbi:MAG: MBL fold metallo-hydrolase, partial [Comamonadaceae bacterium]